MPKALPLTESFSTLPRRRKLSLKGLAFILVAAISAYMLFVIAIAPPQPPGWVAAKKSILPDPLDDFIDETLGHTFIIVSPGNRKPSSPIQALTLEAIDWIRSNRKLEQLWLERIDLDQANLDWLSTLTYLEELVFEGTHLNDEHLKGIGGATPLKIIKLTISNKNKQQDATTGSTPPTPSISQQGIKHLASLPNLERLHIEQLPIGDAAFADLAGMPNLQQLTLPHCTLSGTLLQSISTTGKLIVIDLSNNPIQDESLEHISHLKKLYHLGLNETPITDLALKYIGQLRGNLYALQLSHTHITDSGLQYLSQLKNLNHLNLSNTPITDTGLAHIAKLSKLEYLFLHDTKITDAGFLAVSKLPNLRMISLSFNFGKKYPKLVNDFKKTHQVLFL